MQRKKAEPWPERVSKSLQEFREASPGRKLLILIDIVCLLMGAIFITGFLIAVLYMVFGSADASLQTYDGRVVEKRVFVHESEEGSYARTYLVIEGRNGRRLQVPVSREIFDKAQVGMLIRKDQQGIKLSWPENRPTGRSFESRPSVGATVSSIVSA